MSIKIEKKRVVIINYTLRESTCYNFFSSVLYKLRHLLSNVFAQQKSQIFCEYYIYDHTYYDTLKKNNKSAAKRKRF